VQGLGWGGVAVAMIVSVAFGFYCGTKRR